jgi:aminopeptidase-like protein
MTTLPSDPPEPRDAAEAIRRRIEALDVPAVGARMHGLVRELYPICRSITGDGVRRSLRVLQGLAPLELHEVPTGTAVFDWEVPKEWNLRRATLRGPDGEIVADSDRLNLHVLNYSVPHRARVGLDELQRHLHSLPDQPALVPYRTSYYREDWGFCIADDVRRLLAPGLYEVDIDTTLEDGSLTYGELVVRGMSDEEVLVSAHCCHPALANDNLSGMVLVGMLGQILSSLSPRYTYRFLVAPGTIGAIAWLALHEATATRIRHGLVAACVGDRGPMTYKRSRRGNADIDRAVMLVLARSGQTHQIRDFTPYGYDERQYCSPGFDLPVGSLTRTPHGEYPEYHTSGDSPDLVDPSRLAESLVRYLEVFEVLEGNRRYENLLPKCEPRLGKRGLYGTVGGQSHADDWQMSLLWVLNLCDGRHALLEVAERSGLPFTSVRRAAQALESAGLLRAVEVTEAPA